jgi:hypothetical protein
MVSASKLRLIFPIVAISLSPIAMPAYGQNVNGCTAQQIQSPVGRDCMRQLDQDVIKGKGNITKTHQLVCTITGMRCCVGDDKGHFSDCGPLLVAEPECATLKSERGVWTANPKTIKANADKKTCSQEFTCGPPEKLSSDQRKCAPVVAVSHKTVTQTGTCVPGNSAGTCSSCLAKEPNDPCVINFRKP